MYIKLENKYLSQLKELEKFSIREKQIAKDRLEEVSFMSRLRYARLVWFNNLVFMENI